jgi:hypothetical protein
MTRISKVVFSLIRVSKYLVAGKDILSFILTGLAYKYRFLYHRLSCRIYFGAGGLRN